MGAAVIIFYVADQQLKLDQRFTVPDKVIRELEDTTIQMTLYWGHCPQVQRYRLVECPFRINAHENFEVVQYVNHTAVVFEMLKDYTE